MDQFIYGGISDAGYKRDINEDYINAQMLGDDLLFGIVADGAGSKCSALQPASIVASEIIHSLRRVYDADKTLLEAHSDLFLAEAMFTSNRVLGAFKAGNEELYAGFGASVTCYLCNADGKMTFAHSGNTRLYLVRVSERTEETSIKQLTQDHTKAKKLLDEGLLTPEHYHTHPDRLLLTSGLGVLADPVIQTFSTTLKENDILLLTSDGVHYAVRPEAIMQLVISSENCDSAAGSLIEAAKLMTYPDNMSALIMWYKPVAR